MTPELVVPEVVDELVRANAPVAIGVSGGKDSVACALGVARFLAHVKHTGPKVLVHADLGLVEWADSRPSCERVAAHVDWPLHVTQRRAGGMMERWEGRWAANVKRYKELSCVKLILPWSTPSMRFCTSELKSAPIASCLKQLFGNQPILSVTGIRADESANRAKMASFKANPRLPAGSLDWNPILRWTREDVFAFIALNGLKLHEAYTVFGSSRVSCAFCIMSTASDIQAALRDGRNTELYRRMCWLELYSGFAFQGRRWLSEARKQDWGTRLQRAKDLMDARERMERRIPKHLLFTKGWPEVMPDDQEAELLSTVRTTICDLYDWPRTICTPDEILNRYDALMRAKPKA